MLEQKGSLSTMPSWSGAISAMLVYIYADRNRTQRNTKSLLLKLPQELKNRIYGLVCGGQDVHISSEYIRGFGMQLLSSICQHPGSQVASYERFSAVCADDHKNKHEEPYFTHGICILAKREMSIPKALGRNLLLSCSQIYHEAMLVPISSNTFFFTAPSDLIPFSKKLSPAMRRAVRSIHLDIELKGVFSERQWNKTVAATVVSKLKGLQHLSIAIRRRHCLEETPRLAYTGARHDYGLAELMSCRIPTLKTVEVMVTDELSRFLSQIQRLRFHMLYPEEPPHYWTLKQRKDWAKFIERKLLGLED